jgi:hypothetical protein
LAPLAVVFTAGVQSVAQSTKSNLLNLSPNHVTASVANLEREADWHEHVLGFHRSKLLGGRKDFGLNRRWYSGTACEPDRRRK